MRGSSVDRRVDLGQRQPLADHPRHQLPGRPRLRRLPERRPRLLPRRRHRGLQRPRPQPGRAGATRQAAAEAGAALRQERRRRLLVGQQPQHLHPQRRRRERRVRLPLRGHADRPTSTWRCRCSSPTARSKPVDIRTLPFVRFEDNEAHCQRRHAFNLGGGVAVRRAERRRRRPRRPSIRSSSATSKLWNVHWAFHPVSPVGAGGRHGHPQRRVRHLAAGLQAPRLPRREAGRTRSCRSSCRTQRQAARKTTTRNPSPRRTTCRR